MKIIIITIIIIIIIMPTTTLACALIPPLPGIPVDCLEITDLLPGSIIVKFKIKGDASSLPAQPSALAANLLEQARHSARIFPQNFSRAFCVTTAACRRSSQTVFS